MSSFRLFLCVVLVGLLAIFVGAPFYFSPPSVDGVVATEKPAPESPPLLSSGTPPLPPPARDTRPLGSRVSLVEPVIFPVNSGSRLVGHVRAKQGTTVELVAENEREVVIRLVNSSVRAPRHTVAALDPAEDEASPTLTESARTVGQRIVEYWFPGRTRGLSPQAQ